MSLFWIAILIGAAQLVAGAALGWCFARVRRGRLRNCAEVRGMREVAARLDDLTGAVFDDVQRHRSQLGVAQHDLESLDDGRLTEAVVAAVDRIVDVNRRLELRLHDAEGHLRQQSEKLDTYLTHAQTDPLTGLPNRRAMTAEVGRLLAAGGGDAVEAWLVVLDVDHFKRLNDTHGHAAGDRTLVELGQRLRASVRLTDLVARIGGEEFAVLLPGAPQHVARRVVERIRRTVSGAAVATDRGEVQTTVSLGLARFEPGDNYDAVFRRADAALYAAKRAGRNRGYYHNGAESVQICPSDGAEPSAPSPPELAAALAANLAANLAAANNRGGQTLLSVGDDSASSPPTPPAQPLADPPSEALLHLCENLRSRLNEVIQPRDE